MMKVQYCTYVFEYSNTVYYSTNISENIEENKCNLTIIPRFPPRPFKYLSVALFFRKNAMI